MTGSTMWDHAPAMWQRMREVVLGRREPGEPLQWVPFSMSKTKSVMKRQGYMLRTLILTYVSDRRNP